MKRNPRELDLLNRRTRRRALLVGGLQLAVAGALVLRMRYLQIEQADQYRLLAEENRINIRLIPPTRGRIYDRNGVILAQNRQSYRIVIVPEDAGDVEKVIANLRRLIPISPEDIENALEEMHRSAPFLPVTLVDQVAWDDMARVAANGPALPGVTPEVGLTRFYPQHEVFAHVVGYVGPVSDYDLKRLEDPDQVLRIPRFQIGKTGIEAQREDLLRGKAGARRVEVNATGRVMRELGRQKGTPGADLQLTVDTDLQAYILDRVQGQSASVVVVDCATGDLRAVASSPSFDPNLFVRGISVADYRALMDDPYRPLTAKFVQGTYPPGSTFKMIVALAAMEEGVMTPDDTTFCPGYLELADRRFYCWKNSGHGRVDLLKSLEQSCDVYYYELALKIGIEKIAEMARRLGLGYKYDLPLSAIAHGNIPTKAWKQGRYGREWLIGDTVNAAIGQGYVLASPIQLAVMTARLATGRAVTPRLIKSINGIEQPSGAGEPLGLDENDLRVVRRGMFQVSNSRRGTAFRSRIAEKTLLMAGKTGTSQVRNISAAERASGVIRNEDLPWERRDHALFVCYAPFEAPRYAVSVVVEHGGGGSTAAAPVARDVILQALYDGTPPLSAYPERDRPRIRAQQERLSRERARRDAGKRDRA